MGDIAVRVENLSKQYRIGAKQESYRTFRDSITDALTAPFKRVAGLLRGNAAAAANLSETIWALKDVSFEVKKGEVVGIIGRNGAGKSTLLKILSRITEPTSGEAKVYGRVGALLEVGTGFHPELTGRENIYLNGAILGMSREEIKRKFDEIVAFAEVEKFIDTPVKHYSSGMGLRLGFAVAAHLEPEILIVDEVLAVGDAAFQKKCLGKMGEVAGEGRTVLFVSHNMAAVQSLCQRSVWLEQGKSVLDGRSTEVVSAYLQTGASVTTERVWQRLDMDQNGNEVGFTRISVTPFARTDTVIAVNTPLVFDFEYWNDIPNSVLNLTLRIRNSSGITVLTTAPLVDELWVGKPFPKGLFKSTCYLPGDLLNDDRYFIDVLVIKDFTKEIASLNDVLIFDVADSPALRTKARWYGKWIGVIRPNLEWKTEQIMNEQIEA